LVPLRVDACRMVFRSA